MPQNGLSMFDYYISIGINPYSIGAIGFAGGGGGALAANSVSSSNIVDGTVETVDLADGIITEAKFHPTLQTSLATFSQSLFNLENPGFYGTLRIKNSNTSNVGATMTITVQSEYYDAPSNTTDIIPRLTTTTLNRGNHIDIVIPISTRLTNKDSIFRMYYTLNFGALAEHSNVNVNVDEISTNAIGDFVTFGTAKTYAVINGGSVEISFEIS
ncbi:hypothetical protein [Chrysochromulina parva virophage Curly]|nr:hypothetical protein [Chrysochromulina parva virophage Curly]